MSDLISRQDAIDEIQMLLEQSEDDEHDKTWNNAIRGAVNAVKHHTKSAQPTIDAVEVKHGEWMEEGSSCSYIFHCSVCGGVAYFVHGKGRGRNIVRRFCGYRYCPNCGAKMDGERRDPCS